MSKLHREFVLFLDDDPAAMPALFAYMREVARRRGVQSEDYKDAQAIAYAAPGFDPTHQCHFCGTDVTYGYEADGKRHWLSDCRPDLVEHKPGSTCTWWNSETGEARCYAYQDNLTREWTDKHEHFYDDGPM